jgi:hypothetical protein
MSVLKTLTEGIVHRDVSKEGAALLDKWEATGLLEGLSDERTKNGMAVLLENQAKELLREASSMSAGDVEGFASVAFPIVRRVFGGLIANDLVSVQPMSLPSGLIFFMDFVHGDTKAGMAAGDSVYGGNVVGRGLIGGVDLDEDLTKGGPGGFYDLGTGYSSPTGSVEIAAGNVGQLIGGADQGVLVSALTEAQKKLLRYDPDVLANTGDRVSQVVVSSSAVPATLNKDALTGITIETADGSNALGSNVKQIRRLTSLDSSGNLRLVLVNTAGAANAANGTDRMPSHLTAIDINFPLKDTFEGAGSPANLGAILATEFGLEGAGDSGADGAGALGTTQLRPGRIPEIDIKVDSIAVTAVTKKLKAKWTPELSQDLNAYHNLDAEVELTGILSEQIALEIDQEILGDLIVGAKAGTRYWSRAPGLFVDSSGAELGATSASPDFTGTVSEWYETLIETINDVSAQIHRKTLRGGANFVVCSPEVANILEFTSGFRASVTADADRGDIGAVRVGSLSKKFDVMVDPYFPRNVLLVGRKGNSFLESGFVYAPYVPLQVTPTIFGQEDFVPRKGVMTRYAKQMVRPDMYGLVIVRGLLGEAGAS